MNAALLSYDEGCSVSTGIMDEEAIGGQGKNSVSGVMGQKPQRNRVRNEWEVRKPRKLT